MTDLATLDRAYYLTMQYFVDRGQGPHYVELAADMGLSTAAGRQVLHELVDSGIPAWVHPDTDYLVSFAPFHNLPTQYRITIDGEQKWFAQGGFEALAVRWLFPGKILRMEAPCLDCGEPMWIDMDDAQVYAVQPSELVGYAYSEIGGPPENRAYRGAGMNLFRSEAHARRWELFNIDYENNLQPLSAWVERFSADRFRERLRPDYISWTKSRQ